MVKIRRLMTFVPVLVLAPLGCTSKRSQDPAPSPTVTPSVTSPATPSVTTPAPGVPGAPASEPAAFAFLKALETGTVKLDDVSPRFLRAFAPPGVLSMDRERGYDADEAKRWFDSLKGSYSPPQVKTQDGDKALYVGTYPGGRYALRLAGSKLDWFQRLPATSTAEYTDTLPAVFAADCVLASMIAPAENRSTRFVASFFSPELLTTLGEPFPSDRERGYNVATFQKALARLTNGATGYHLRPVGGGVVKAELSGASPRTLVFRVASTKDGWVVQELRPE